MTTASLVYTSIAQKAYCFCPRRFMSNSTTCRAPSAFRSYGFRVRPWALRADLDRFRWVFVSGRKNSPSRDISLPSVATLGTSDMLRSRMDRIFFAE